jgi:NOL1/NOP2/fmu family ribosome biogenesis protein
MYKITTYKCHVLDIQDNILIMHRKLIYRDKVGATLLCKIPISKIGINIGEIKKGNNFIWEITSRIKLIEKDDKNV